MRQFKLLLLMLLWLPMTAFAARSAPLLDADIAAHPKLSTAEIGTAVKQALAGRRWVVTKDRGSALEAAQITRGLTAKISVSWDKSTIRIRYVDSSGLNFEQIGEARTIHPTYNKWVANLQKDIPVFMERIAITK